MKSFKYKYSVSGTSEGGAATVTWMLQQHVTRNGNLIPLSTLPLSFHSDDRQMDFAEQIESVAYVICGDKSQVSFKNFRDIWHTRGVSMLQYHAELDIDISIIICIIYYVDIG